MGLVFDIIFAFGLIKICEIVIDIADYIRLKFLEWCYKQTTLLYS